MGQKLKKVGYFFKKNWKGIAITFGVSAISCGIGYAVAKRPNYFLITGELFDEIKERFSDVPGKLGEICYYPESRITTYAFDNIPISKLGEFGEKIVTKNECIGGGLGVLLAGKKK